MARVVPSERGTCVLKRPGRSPVPRGHRLHRYPSGMPAARKATYFTSDCESPMSPLRAGMSTPASDTEIAGAAGEETPPMGAEWTIGTGGEDLGSVGPRCARRGGPRRCPSVARKAVRPKLRSPRRDLRRARGSKSVATRPPRSQARPPLHGARAGAKFNAWLIVPADCVDARQTGDGRVQMGTSQWRTAFATRVQRQRCWRSLPV